MRNVPIQTWLFDLDNTLYSPYSTIFPQIHRKMDEYIMQYFNLPFEAASARRTDYFHRYGTTLSGLMAEEHVDPTHFMDFVHAIDYSELKPDAELNALIANLPGDKMIFTNADRRHGARVLKALGLEDQFTAIFDIEDAAYECKPQPGCYKRLLAAHRLDAHACAMIDDMEQNLKPAAAMGMTTFWLRHEATWQRKTPGLQAMYPHCHYAGPDLKSLLQQMNGLAHDDARPQRA